MNSLDHIISRIQKLLALSQSSNEHEAANAAAQAARLMAEYQIDQARLEVEDKDESHTAEPIETLYVRSDTPQRNRQTWKGYIASAVARDVGAQMYWSGITVTLFGRRSACQAASYTYLYLVREVERLRDAAWEREKAHTTEHGKSWKHSFAYGAALTISARLREAREMRQEELRQQAHTDTDCRALALVHKRDTEVTQAWERKSKGMRSSSGTGATSIGGFDRGKAAGHSINLGSGRGALGTAAPQIKGR